MKRPKSAVLLSLPYTFQNKTEAVQIKHKVKKCLLTFQSEESISYPNNFNPYQNQKSSRSYVDNGPSLLNSAAGHYTSYQNQNHYIMANANNAQNCSNAFNRYSTALSCASKISSLKGSRTTIFTKTSSKQNLKNRKSFDKTQKKKCQNYFFFQPEKLQPCRLIKQKSRQSIMQCLKKSNQQTDFINRIFLNYPQPKMSNSQQILKEFQMNKSKMKAFDKQNFTVDGKTLCNISSKNTLSSDNIFNINSQNLGNNKLAKKSRTILNNFT